VDPGRGSSLPSRQRNNVLAAPLPPRLRRVAELFSPRAPHGAPHGGPVEIDRLEIWLNQAENSKPSNGLEPLTPSLPWAFGGYDTIATARQIRMNKPFPGSR
jgi:hypothetical protein